LLTNFDLDVTYLRVDKELADLSIKELFSDLIWRFCRTSSDDQIRKAMLRTFKKQRSDMVLVGGFLWMNLQLVLGHTVNHVIRKHILHFSLLTMYTVYFHQSFYFLASLMF
jgi:peptide subunit release factor 1 (eRF1)